MFQLSLPSFILKKLTIPLEVPYAHIFLQSGHLKVYFFFLPWDFARTTFEHSLQ